jgi:hypothetical protein
MLPDLGKIIGADQTGQEPVAQAPQKALVLKRQTDARVRESQQAVEKLAVSLTCHSERSEESRFPPVPKLHLGTPLSNPARLGRLP